MNDIKKLPSYFLVALILVSLWIGYLLFRPYLSVLLMGAIFALLFYRPYLWLTKKFKGYKTGAALLTVLIFVLIILIPLGNFVALLVKESIDSLPVLQQKLTSGEAANAANQFINHFKTWQQAYLPIFDTSALDLKKVLLDLGSRFSSFIVNNASGIVSGTTGFLVSLFFMLISMYFFLKDGKTFLNRVTYLIPLPNKYNHVLFQRFEEVSRSTIIGSLVTSIAQGLLATIAYFILGLPAFFLGVATMIAALIPVVGTALVWVPVSIVLFISGNWLGALFLIFFGLVVVSTSDNIIRTFFIGNRVKIHPLLVFFSIFGGIELWGALGIIFGPLVLALILTVVHIYELEYEGMLEQ